MTTSAAHNSVASNFDRALAIHLAARIAEGARCNEPLVRQCCSQARRDLQMAAPAPDDPLAEEADTGFVRNVVGLMETHQNFLARMPEIVAGTFIAELLFDKPW